MSSKLLPVKLTSSAEASTDQLRLHVQALVAFFGYLSPTGP